MKIVIQILLVAGLITMAWETARIADNLDYFVSVSRAKGD